MILDAIIGLFVTLFSSVTEGLAMVFLPIFNLILAAIEVVLGFFISGFSLGRFERKKWENSKVSAIIGVVVTFVTVGLFSWFVLVPKVANREITFVAEDGHSLPFAALVIHTKKGEKHQRTDNAGNIVIPRFSIHSITIKDPRYVEKTWGKSEIDSKMIVERTILGSGLDSLASKLFKPAKE